MISFLDVKFQNSRECTIVTLLISSENSLYQAIQKEKVNERKMFNLCVQAKIISKKFTENIQMIDEHMKRYSPSPVTEEIQNNNEKLFFTWRLTKNIKD